ncbi:MAG: D-glycero-beta-D-manno-heptose-7-phosphate kinase [Thermodesulfobacteriota bacterium]
MDIRYDLPRFLSAIDGFPKVNILVIGDVMLDEFIWGRVERISPEAPVPVVKVTKETRMLGGAANVVNNIISVGGRAMMAGVVGHDRRGREVMKMLEDLGVDAGGLVLDKDRPTTIKTRVVAHAQQVVRFDREKNSPISQKVTDIIMTHAASAARDLDAVIVSDYAKGVVTPYLMDEVRRLFPGPRPFIAVDPKVQNFKLFKKVSIITPNHHEAVRGTGLNAEQKGALVRAGRKIISDLECASVLITRGEKGMTLLENNGPPIHIPTVTRQVFDVTGAGDTVIAILTLARAAGLELPEAAVLANFAAGVVVGKVGTSAVTAADLKTIVSQGLEFDRG